MFLNPDRVAKYIVTPFHTKMAEIDPADVSQWMIWILARPYLWGEQGWPKGWR